MTYGEARKEAVLRLGPETHTILAVIDGDRAVYGDPDFEFASSWMGHPSLLEGSGIDCKHCTTTHRPARRGQERTLFRRNADRS